MTTRVELIVESDVPRRVENAFRNETGSIKLERNEKRYYLLETMKKAMRFKNGVLQSMRRDLLQWSRICFTARDDRRFGGDARKNSGPTIGDEISANMSRRG